MSFLIRHPQRVIMHTGLTQAYRVLLGNLEHLEVCEYPEEHGPPEAKEEMQQAAMVILDIINELENRRFITNRRMMKMYRRFCAAAYPESDRDGIRRSWRMQP